MSGYNIQAAYDREHRNKGDVVVCFIDGGYCSFVKQDAIAVAPILQQPIIRGRSYDEVRLHMGGFAAARDQLVHVGKKLVVLKFTQKNHGRWLRLDLSQLYDLSRFVEAHDIAYADALAELKACAGRSPWVDYMFPRIAGLEFDTMSRRYAIEDIGEAKGYFDHPVLGTHYRECCRAVLEHAGRKTVSEIFGTGGAEKVRASTTLFLRTGFHDAKDLCRRVLDVFYGGEEDPATLSRLGV